MRRSRSRYHRDVILLKIIKIMLKKRMSTALLGHKTRDFWKELDKVNKTNTVLPNLVDDVTGDENISKLFDT